MKSSNKTAFRAVVVVCIFMMLAAAIIPTGAVEAATASGKWFTDEVDVLGADAEKYIEETASEIKTLYGYNVYFASVYSLGSKTAMEYADDLYDKLFPINSTGIILLVSLENRDYWISTSGEAIDFFDTDSRLYNIDHEVVSCLRDNEFENAAKMFATLVKSCLETVARYNTDKDESASAWQNTYCEFISDYRVKPKMPDEYGSFSIKGIIKAFSERSNNSTGMYDYGNDYLHDCIQKFMIVLVISAVIAFIWVGVMKSKMNNVRRNNFAANYVRPDSFKLTQSSDMFLYSTVSKVTRPRPDSSPEGGGGGGSHGSSSGGPHGGTGGKF